MILSICIPTYNRRKKVLNTIHCFYEQLLCSPYVAQIELVVSNNGSTDETKDALAGLNLNGVNFRVFNQPENLGFDGNTKFLYAQAQGQYVWYFGDDDILFDATINTVFESIKDGGCGGMRFSFMQPKGSADLIFKFPANSYQVITDTNTIIECCFTLPKVTTYVLKRVEPLDELFEPIKQYENGGYWFIALAVRVFEMLGEKSTGMIMYNKQFASSDDDVFDLRVEPEVWNNRVVIARYSFIKAHYPLLQQKIADEDYLFIILLLWKYKKGEIKVHDPASYDKYIKDFEVRYTLLRKYPLLLYWIIIIKLNLLSLHNKALGILKKSKSK